LLAAAHRFSDTSIPLHGPRIHTSAVRTPLPRLYVVWMFEADLERR
jgi:hypothetical protein